MCIRDSSYVLQRFNFPGAKVIKTALAATTGVPVIMVIIPLYMIVDVYKRQVH